MKLIDILVQELPKHGGWPEGAVECCSFVDEANIDFYDASGNWPIDCGEKYGAIALKAVRKKTIPCECEKVTREQYESAISATQQPVWNGEGLPPVGCECERSWAGDKWLQCKVLFVSNEHAVVKLATREAAYHLSDVKFRPIRSEADKKREEAINKIQSHCHVDHRAPISAGQAIALYDAIAAGKIPYIQLK